MRSTRTKATASTADASSEPSTPGLRQPVSGASSMPQVNRPSAPVKHSAPRQSSRPRMPAARAHAGRHQRRAQQADQAGGQEHHAIPPLDQPAGGRTEGQADAKGGAQQAEGARAAPWNSGASEDMAAAKRPRRPCPGPAAARPSRRPTAPAQQESGGAEQRQSQQPDAARADQVDQAAGHHDDAAIGQDVAVEHPVQLDGRAAQGLADGRQHHGRAGEAEWMSRAVRQAESSCSQRREVEKRSSGQSSCCGKPRGEARLAPRSRQE